MCGEVEVKGEVSVFRRSCQERGGNEAGPADDFMLEVANEVSAARNDPRMSRSSETRSGRCDA